MAKKKIKKWSEAELMDTFGLKKTKLVEPVLKEWLDVTLQFNEDEVQKIKKLSLEAFNNVEAWNEEDLKMNFIAFVIDLSGLKSNDRYRTYYEKTVESEIDGHYLKIKTDFMVAKGVLDLVKTPYFHFQEYKKEKDPHGDPIAQLLEACLVAQAKNADHVPLYGCYVRCRFWYFLTLSGKEYCVSKAYDCTDDQELSQIIAILRKFKEILETRLLD